METASVIINGCRFERRGPEEGRATSREPLIRLRLVFSFLFAALLSFAVVPSVALASPGSRTVYVSGSGKYHYVSDCSGMKHYTEMTLAEAVASGKKPCSDCVKDGGLTDEPATSPSAPDNDVPAPGQKPNPDPSPTRKLSRLEGQTRYDTMGEIVGKAYSDDKSEYVVVASGENFPDALTASALAGKLDAPVVLTGTNELSDVAKREIDHVSASKAIIVGGPDAISSAVAEQIKRLPGMRETKRFAGDTRVETANAVYGEGRGLGGKWSSLAIVVTADNYADALSVSPYAYLNRSPIFLCQVGEGLDDEVLADLDDFSSVLIVGGGSAVSYKVEEQLYKKNLTVNRIGGATRYDTSAFLADKFYDTSFLSGQAHYSGRLAVFATGDNFPDALVGSVLSGRNASPLLLVGSGDQDVTISWAAAKSAQFDEGFVLGGRDAISQERENSIHRKVLY